MKCLFFDNIAFMLLLVIGIQSLERQVQKVF